MREGRAPVRCHNPLDTVNNSIESVDRGARISCHRTRESPFHMQANPNEPGGTASLFPFPEGWYFIASRKTIEKEKLLRKTWLGEGIVVWCNDDGEVCVAEAVCPHLGSDLGPEAGGQVRNGRLVCPFHGFEYDIAGQCVATPYAPAPRSARLRVFETREILGLFFAWWSEAGRPPQWELPAPPPAETGWSESDMEFWSVRFAGHPQETSENSVDLGHLRYVHGYDNVSAVGPVTVDGAWLKSCFDFRRTQTIAGIRCFTYDVSAVTHVHGLGYSYVEVRERYINMETRLWVLATPIDGEVVELTLVSQLRRLTRPRRPIVGLRFLPLRLRTRVMNKIIMAAQKRDVLQDVVIWGRKRYRPHPRLCRSDGPIGKFRRYCEQFYPDGQIVSRNEAVQLPVRTSR